MENKNMSKEEDYKKVQTLQEQIKEAKDLIK